jgi:hypothetical protein
MRYGVDKQMRYRFIDMRKTIADRNSENKTYYFHNISVLKHDMLQIQSD